MATDGEDPRHIIPASLVIRGGTVIDGSGAPAFQADVAVLGETIAAIGQDLRVEPTARVLDARGLVVAPGWIDIHTHYDAQASWDPLLTPSAHCGVTTALMGNCGVGFAPCQKELRGFLVSLMEAVEDIPGTALHDGISWEWETFPEYLDALDRKSFACDLAAMIGHGCVRTWVLGKRASLSDRPGGPENDPVTGEEIQAMAEVVREAVSAGAMGFSTSRVLLHRDKHGVLTPGTLAARAELLSLGRAVAEGGGGLVELASDFMTLDDRPPDQHDPKVLAEYRWGEFTWMVEMAKEHGSKVSISFGMDPKSCAWFRRFAKLIGEEGSTLKLQVQTRPQAVHMSLASGTHPFTASRAFWKAVEEAKGGPDALRKLLSSDARKAQILSEMSKFRLQGQNSRTDYAGDPMYGNEQGVMTPSWMLSCHNFFPWTATYEPAAETGVQARAARGGRTPLEECYDLLLDVEAAHAGVLWRPLFGYEGNNDAICKALKMDHVIPGFDDAGAHCSVLTDATAATHLLAHYGRDRTGGTLPLERLVQVNTAEPAALLGLSDRGLLRPGKRADINIMDFGNLKVMAPYWATDLPTGAGRWVQYCQGYRFTVLRGTVTFEDGEPTGALPGRLVRNPRSVKLPAGSKIAAAAGEAEIPELDLREYAVQVSQAKTAGLSAVARTLRATSEARPSEESKPRSRL